MPRSPQTVVEIPTQRLVELCRRWLVREMSLFGSAIRTDFRPSSDVDVLVEFSPAAAWSAFDLVDFQDELSSLFARPVDVVERSALRNPFRRRSILSSRRVIYAA